MQTHTFTCVRTSHNHSLSIYVYMHVYYVMFIVITIFYTLIMCALCLMCDNDNIYKMYV